MTLLSKTTSAIKSDIDSGAKLLRLENGVRIIFDPLPYIKSATVGVWVNIGTRNEIAAQNGIAHLLEHIVFKGAGTRNARQLAEDAEANGIYLNASTSYERTGFYARCLGEEAGFAFGLCADLVLAPIFDKNDFALEKNVVLHEINEAFDDAEDRAGVLNQMAAFNNQPLGRPILGDEQSLEAISHENLIDFHQQYLNPNNIIIAFGGAFNQTEALELINARFGHLKPSPLIPITPTICTNLALFESRKIEQLQINLSMYAPKSINGDIFSSQIFGAILGGGMASRLFQDLREKRGLVYAIDAYPERFVDIGRLNIGAGTNVKSAKEVIKRTLGHIEDLANHGPNDGEMARAKKTIATSIMMSLENSSSRLSAAVNQISVLGRLIGIDEINNGIKQVDGDTIRSLALKALGKNLRAASGVGAKGHANIEEFLVC
jgi:predicted Zn-dependent peptidase